VPRVIDGSAKAPGLMQTAFCSSSGGLHKNTSHHKGSLLLQASSFVRDVHPCCAVRLRSQSWGEVFLGTEGFGKAKLQQRQNSVKGFRKSILVSKYLQRITFKQIIAVFLDKLHSGNKQAWWR